MLSVTEFARRLGGISPCTVYSWLSQGRIERTKVGRRTMIATKIKAKGCCDKMCDINGKKLEGGR